MDLWNQRGPGSETAQNTAQLQQPVDRNVLSGESQNAAQAKQEQVLPVGPEQVSKFIMVLNRYKAGKQRTESRIVSSENWWKIRNSHEERHKEGLKQRDGWNSQSSWLHNVINNKHADAMDSFPQPVVLARERMDEPEAKLLSSIIPCVLEMDDFEQVYSDVMWQKLKGGTGVYRITWDKNKLGGLGDISIARANLLNLYWEPGVTNIQKSRYFFETELVDDEIIEEMYPQSAGKIKGSRVFESTRFQYDDSVSTEGKSTVVSVYYHKNGLLHYCKFCGDTILESTENDPELRQEGIYDHGMYPYVFDALYPIEGSPCGYSYVDICRNTQTEIDLMRTAIVQNAMSNVTPRVFLRSDGNINEEEYLDLTKAVVHVQGNLGEDALRVIPQQGLSGNYISLLEESINELRETSGNTEASTGTVSSSVTAAASIAALQEASGKTSRDATRNAYRAYRRIVEIVIELIRQFYDVPRQFRIVGEMGVTNFIEYSNKDLKLQDQGTAFGMDMGYRKPLFDVTVEAQKKSQYSTLSQNELALQFYQAGFFNPQLSDQALAAIDMMEFVGKEKVEQRISQNGTMYQQLQMMMQYAATMAMENGDEEHLQQIANMSNSAAAAAGMADGADTSKQEFANGANEESTHMQKAREQTQNASQVK